MKKWLLQTSTIGGLLMFALTGIQLAQSGATGTAIASGIVSAALLAVKDGRFLKGLVPVLFVGLMATSTGCSKIDLPPSMTAEQVESTICVGMGMDKCLDASMDVIGIRQESCEEDIGALIRGDISLDAGKLSKAKAVCQNYVTAVLSYIDRAKEVAKKAKGL